MKFLIISILFTVILTTASTQNVICYFTSWTIYRPDRGMFNVSNVPADLCTHIYYGFVGLNPDGSINNMDPYESYDLHEFAHLRRLKLKNPQLKLILSMGGWNEGSDTYSSVSKDENLRQTLAENVIKFLEKIKFDGFDLDWEYPAQRGGVDEDVEDFIKLLGVLNKAFKAHPKKYLLSVAVSGGIASADTSYNYKEIADVLDYINVMAYDYHGDWEPYTGHFAPLHASPMDTGENRDLNVVSGFNHWIEKGVPPSKLNLGIGTYGRTFTLKDPTQSGLYAPTTGAGKAGKWTEEAGTIGFNEICAFYGDQEQAIVYDEDQMVPHMVVDGDQWIGFEDVASVAKKSKFARDSGAAGVMVWSLDTDDFLNICGKGAYPLVNSMKNAWTNEILIE